jgi:glutaredoxin 3
MAAAEPREPSAIRDQLIRDNKLLVRALRAPPLPLRLLPLDLALRRRTQPYPAAPARQVVGKSYCPYTKRAREALTKLQLHRKDIDLDTTSDGDALQAAFAHVSGIKTVPQVFIGGKCLGGCDATLDAIKTGAINEKLAAAGLETGA